MSGSTIVNKLASIELACGAPAPCGLEAVPAAPAAAAVVVVDGPAAYGPPDEFSAGSVGGAASCES